jgi:hypothetical protein
MEVPVSYFGFNVLLNEPWIHNQPSLPSHRSAYPKQEQVKRREHSGSFRQAPGNEPQAISLRDSSDSRSKFSLDARFPSLTTS